MYFAAVVDEHSLVPIGTAISVVAVIVLAAWKIRGKVDSWETSLGSLKDGINAQLGSLQTQINALKSERRFDTDMLRSELVTSQHQVCPYNGLHKVLIIDDNANDRLLFRHALTPEFSVDEANGLVEAMKKLERGKYDCVLLDLRLPDSMNNNFTVAEFMRCHPSALCIAMSGQESPGSNETVMDQGADGFLNKNNSDPVYISNVVRNSIRRHKLKQ